MPVFDDDDDDVEGEEAWVRGSREDSRDEMPDGADVDRPERDFIRCAKCRKYIPDDAPQCPYCRHWQMEREHTRKPLWFFLGVLGVIGAVILWIMYTL